MQGQSQSGFTFLEVLIAISVLSFGILGLLTTSHTVSVNQRSADQVTEATMMATDELEEIKRLATNEPLGGIYGFKYLVDTSATGYLNSTDFASAPNDFTRVKTNQYHATDHPDITPGFTRITTLRVHPFDDGTVTAMENFATTSAQDQIHMVEAIVNVTWNDHDGRTRNVELSTVLQRRQFIQ